MGYKGAVNGESKQKGTRYEMLFISKCMKMGLHPHDTVGDYLQHDMLVMNDAGCVHKVQVKGTNYAVTERRKTPRYRITAKKGNNTSVKSGLGKLDCTKIDILAAYVEPCDVWYLIPCLAIKSMAVWFYPDIENSKATYEKYKENWDCFF